MPMIGTPHLTTANDTTVAWSELGSGTPLLLLHGLAESHRTWRLVVPKLAERFHVFLLDLPGHGLSARPEAPYTVKWYADTVAAWMGAVGLERAHVCGHSFGGGVAQWMLIEHRERVDRLALAAAGGLGPEVGAALRLAAVPFAAPFLESSLFGSGTRLFMRWASRSFAIQEAHEVERLALLNAAPNSGLAFRRTVSACIDIRGQHVQTWHHIHRAKSLPPIALFWGERDSIIPVQHAHDAGRRLENAAVTVYPECGHSLHLEAPERFAHDLSAFLEERGRASARLRPGLHDSDQDRANDAISVLPAVAA
jgi:pimeloyl-ACP methyl ester carboxylesterase